MSKIVTSPVKRFTGTVTFSQPLNYDQYISWSTANEALGRSAEAGKVSPEDERTIWRALYPCVEAWNITNWNVTGVAEIPSSPRTPVISLLFWLVHELTVILTEDDDAAGSDPNA